jgi:hypothetical protein
MSRQKVFDYNYCLSLSLRTKLMDLIFHGVGLSFYVK